MNFEIVSYNSNNINDGTNFVAKFPKELSLSPKTSIKAVRRAGAFPIYAGKEFPPHSFTITIICMGTFNSQLQTLGGYFDITDETPHSFVVQDADDGDEQYAVDAVPVQFTPIVGKKAVQVVMSVTSDPVWKQVTQNSSTWNITTSGDTKLITVGGNVEAYPVFEVTPTSNPTDTFLYIRYVTVYPTSTNEWVNRPLEITNGGWDTATLVSGGKMQSDGDDLRVLVNGRQVDRWLNGMNGATTKVWITLTMPQKAETTLKTAITSSGTPSTIDIQVTGANRRTLRRMPKRGIVLINSEQFTYTDKTISPDVLSLTVNSRAVRNTSAAAHSASDNVRWIPYDIQIKYGNALSGGPDTTDISPVVSLASTNAAFTYDEFQEIGYPLVNPGDRARIKAPDSWRFSQRGDTANPLTETGKFLSDNDNDGNEFANPSEVMGSKIVALSSSASYIPSVGVCNWHHYFPDEVTSITSNGNKYRVGSFWPSICALSSSKDGENWVQEWNESSPGTPSSWTAWTHNSEAVPSGTTHIRFILKGIVSGTSGACAKFEVSSATINLTNPPTVSLGSEVQVFTFDAILKNNTTGDKIKIDYPTELNTTLYINCDPDNPTAIIDGTLIYSSVGLNTTRNKWMTVEPGNNTFSFTQANTGNVTVVIKWYDRMVHL